MHFLTADFPSHWSHLGIEGFLSRYEYDNGIVWYCQVGTILLKFEITANSVVKGRKNIGFDMFLWLFRREKSERLSKGKEKDQFSSIIYGVWWIQLESRVDISKEDKSRLEFFTAFVIPLRSLKINMRLLMRRWGSSWTR